MNKLEKYLILLAVCLGNTPLPYDVVREALTA